MSPCPPHLKINKISHLPMKRSSHSATSSSLSSSSSSSSSSASSSPSPPQSSICSSSASTVMSGPRTGPAIPRGGPRPPPAYQQRQQPVIIYTHSPKVIHTHPRDFMALVQKLTGLYRPQGEDHDEPESPARPKPDGSGGLNNNNNTAKLNSDGIESSSVITEEKSSTCCSNNIIGDHDPMQMMNPNPGFIPQISYEPPNNNNNNPYMNSFSMFDPNNSTDLLCANQPNFFSSYGDRLLFAPQDDETQFHQMPLWR